MLHLRVFGYPGWKTLKSQRGTWNLCYSYGEKCTATGFSHLFEHRPGCASLCFASYSCFTCYSRKAEAWSFHPFVVMWQHLNAHTYTHYTRAWKAHSYSDQIKQTLSAKHPYPLLSFSPNQTLFVTAFLQLWAAPLEKLIIFQLRLKTLPSSLCVTQQSGLLALAGIQASLTGLKIFGCSGH